MSDEVVEPVASTDAGQVAEPVAAPAEPTGGNPAWAPLREKLDPISFRQIEPELSKWENETQQRITSLNDQYKPWKSFADAGATPEKIAQWQSIAEQIDTDPVAFYGLLGQFLETTGRMPNKQELGQITENAGEQPQVGEEPAEGEDPRIAQLIQQNQQMLGVLTEQAKQQQKDKLDAEAETNLNAELEKFKEDHKDYSPVDVKEVIRRAAYTAQMTGKVPTLEEANAEYVAFRTELLTASRPGDSAPKLLPTSGGVPTASGQQRKLSELSRGEMQDMTAAIFAQQSGK